MNVLLVEPDMILGQTYLQFLQKQGHQVVWERSAEKAIQALDTSPIDTVILELLIPGHNGMEFLYEMRSYADWQTLPIIIHSFLPATTFATSLTYKDMAISKHLYKPETTLKHLASAVQELSKS